MITCRASLLDFAKFQDWLPEEVLFDWLIRRRNDPLHHIEVVTKEHGNILGGLIASIFDEADGSTILHIEYLATDTPERLQDKTFLDFLVNKAVQFSEQESGSELKAVLLVDRAATGEMLKELGFEPVISTYRKTLKKEEKHEPKATEETHKL